MFTQNSEKQKTKGTKILLNCWVRVLIRTLLHNWINGKDTSPDEMKVFLAHLIVMGILKKNSLEQYWSRDSILNMPFFVTTCPEIVFKTSCGIFTSVIQMRPTHQREKQTMILCFWLGQWWTWCKGISIQSTGQERNYLWMKAHVLLRVESISSVTTPKSQTGSILNFLWSVNWALATFVALKFIQEMHLASHRVMCRNYRMHQKTSCTVPRFVRLSTVVGHGSSCLILIIITTALTWLICCTRGKLMHEAQSGKIKSHSL